MVPTGSYGDVDGLTAMMSERGFSVHDEPQRPRCATTGGRGGVGMYAPMALPGDTHHLLLPDDTPFENDHFVQTPFETNPALVMDHFKVIKRLGRGGQGTALLAELLSVHADFVLKFPTRILDRDIANGVLHTPLIRDDAMELKRRYDANVASNAFRMQEGVHNDPRLVDDLRWEATVAQHLHEVATAPLLPLYSSSLAPL